MPVVGEFHAKYWKARANPIVAPGTSVNWMYPLVQSVTGASSMGSLFGALQPVWEQLIWYWHMAIRLWHWRAPTNQARLEIWIARLEELDSEQHAVLERVLTALQHQCWPEAKHAVRVVATSPKFHQPEQWVEYGRALKANRGQAQNVFRHVKAVSALRDLADGPAILGNPEAHLLIELAYQGLSATQATRKPSVVVEHPVLHYRQ